MTVERVTRAHLSAIAALEREVFATPWSEKALELLCTDTAVGFVVMESERAVAYGGIMGCAGEGQITNIATSPAYRRRGLGEKIMAALVHAACEREWYEIWLEVRESNAPAIALYEKFGFTAKGKRPRFYTNPVETAIVMLLSLQGEK